MAGGQHSCSMGISLGAGLSRGRGKGPGKWGSSTPGFPGIRKVSPSVSLGETWGIRSDGLSQSLSWASLGLGPRTGKADEMDMANAKGF